MAPETAGDCLLREDAGALVTLTLNRPARSNALSEELVDALAAQLDALERDRGARAVVIAGAGRNFCAGHDLKEMRSHPDRERYRRLFERSSETMLRLGRIPQPVIARVQGIATAAGCQLVAACDLAVAASDARFATPGVDIGLFCATPSVPLARNVSRKRAFEMLVTGETIGAAAALEYGLVNRVVPPDELDASVRALAELIASKPAAVVRDGKRVFYEQLAQGTEAAYAQASDAMTRGMMSPDAREGIDAFLEKRPPEWPEN